MIDLKKRSWQSKHRAVGCTAKLNGWEERGGCCSKYQQTFSKYQQSFLRNFSWYYDHWYFDNWYFDTDPVGCSAKLNGWEERGWDLVGLRGRRQQRKPANTSKSCASLLSICICICVCICRIL